MLKFSVHSLIAIGASALLLTGCQEESAPAGDQAAATNANEASAATAASAEVASAASDASEDAAAKPAAGTQTIALQISGMSCDGCANRIENAVAKLDGVESCEVQVLDDGTGEGVFVVDGGQVSSGTLIAAVEEMDFGARLKDADAATAASGAGE